MTEQQRKRPTFEQQRARRANAAPSPVRHSDSSVRDKESVRARLEARNRRAKQAKASTGAAAGAVGAEAISTENNSASAGHSQTRHHIPLVPITLGVAAILAAAFLLRLVASAITIDVTINGIPYTLHGAKTVQTAIKVSGLPINPGDLISLKGTVIRRGEGLPVTADINGITSTDLNRGLFNGDRITLTDGEDIVEEYDAVPMETPYEVEITGRGAIHKITPGVHGIYEIRRGKLSGEEVKRKTSDPEIAKCFRYNPNVGEDKVLALTFEQGPSPEYTQQILDILKENDAKATFFFEGEELKKYNDGVVIRALDDGNQVSLAPYNFTSEKDAETIFDMDLPFLEDQVKRGAEALKEVLGDRDYTPMIRMPAGKATDDIVSAVDDYAEYSIGWNVDSGDWMESSSQRIYGELMSLTAGDIVRLHDGGGNHQGTVDALREAIPVLIERGYKFVTVADLLKYEPL